MRILVITAILLSLLTIIFWHIFRSDGTRDRYVILLLSLAVLAISVDLLTGEKPPVTIMMDVMPAVVGMFTLISSLWERSASQKFVLLMAVSSVIPALYNLSFIFGWMDSGGAGFCHLFLVLSIILLAGQFLLGVIKRLRSVKQVLRAGAVWTGVGLAIDAFYVMAVLLWSMVYIFVRHLSQCEDNPLLWMSPFMIGMTLAAAGIRGADDVKFVIWRNQERRIMESMKVTQVETAVDPAGIDDVYQDIYERVLAYFEAEKPFLDNDLTINDLVKVLYSNKLYISRAISQFTGRNFCQFVNFHRVKYSMELFRGNNDLKIHELAVGSGFNSDVSYNMAFRLFMGETPGEWCRKERDRRFKVKK